jgi:hypothetical protein
VPPKSDELTAADFTNAGRTEGTMTIERIEPGHQFTKDEAGVEVKGAFHFAGHEKPWRAISINTQCCAAMWGDDYEDWVGHKLTIHVVPCEVKGQYFGQPSLRVKGSPDLAAAKRVEIVLPRRRPWTVTLVPTGRQGEGQ